MIENAITDGGAGHGKMIILEGPSGIGKSRLVAAAQVIGEKHGAEVLTTCGGELERDYPFGLVRRLLEARVARASPAARKSLFRGHARLSESLLRPQTADGGSALIDEFNLIHSLYWLVVNLTDHRPLVLLADDLQWGDELSLRFVLYLSQRLGELPITLIGAVRTGDPAADDDLVSRVMLQAGSTLRPAELSIAATKELFATLLPAAAGNVTVVEESWTATHGNPFLLGELASVLSSRSVADLSHAGVHIPDAAPESVARSVVLRLAGLGDDVAALARAVAVLGTSTSLTTAAGLCRLDFAAATTAADRLRTAQIFSDAGDLAFHHPMIRTAIYRKYPPHQRAQAHLEAARLLHREGADLDKVAVHLMRGTPTTEEWARAALQAAARAAGRKGAPAAAAGYLRRALLVPNTDRRADASVLVDLGIMEAAAGEKTSLAHLETALDLIDEPAGRARAMYALGQTLFRYGRSAEALGVFRRGADMFMDEDRDLALRFEAGYMASASYLVDHTDEAHDRLTALAASFSESDQLSTSERLLVLHLAVFRALTRPHSADHAALAIRALGDGVQLWRDTSDGMTISHVILALTWCGSAREAADTAERVLVEARSRGDSLIFAEISLARSLAMYALGRVSDAMVDAQAAIVGMRRGWNSTVPAPQGVLAYCLIDRGEFDAAAEVLDDAAQRLREGDLATLNVWFYMARGRLRLAKDEPHGALDDFRCVGSLLESNMFFNPGHVLLPWRSHAGLALHALGISDEALVCIDHDIEVAREFGLPSILGAALRARALVTLPVPDIPLLEESARVLGADGASVLELARTLCELGAAQRRAGERVASRETLRRAMDIAHHAGALAVEQQAHDELLASGARPRRAVLLGADALTPSEVRVASLMADGLTSRTIAESLYLTMSTIEWHRRNIYRKLSVSSREELRVAMAGDQLNEQHQTSSPEAALPDATS